MWVGDRSSLPAGTSRIVEGAGRSVAVFNVDGELYALDNACAHRGSSLGDGVVRNGVVTCPAHLWRYDVRTGLRSDAPGYAVASYQVTVEDDEVFVEVPAPEPARSIRDVLLEHARTWRRDE